MSKTAVLVLLSADDPDAAPFRKAVEQDPFLQDRIDLRFATRETASGIIGDCEVVACGVLPPNLLDAAVQLRWMAFWSAGLDGKITPQIQARHLLLTNASGVHGPNIAEHVMAYMLMFTRQMEMHMRAQIAGRWDREAPLKRSGASELTGQTLGIVGLGRIGESLTVRAKAFDMRVIAVKRDPSTRYEAAIQPDALYGLNDLPLLLRESDHVCIALPLTPETHHLFNAAMLAYMKPSAYLYNIARGKIIDESALIDALCAGKIAGAGLDVFEIEPLPADSPLWRLENVILTPHVAGITPHYFARFASLFAANLRRFLNSEPLQNLYDPARGY